MCKIKAYEVPKGQNKRLLGLYSGRCREMDFGALSVGVGSWDKSTYVHLQPWKEFMEECTRSLGACPRQVEEPSQYQTCISMV